MQKDESGVIFWSKLNGGETDGEKPKLCDSIFSVGDTRESFDVEGPEYFIKISSCDYKTKRIKKTN